MKKVTKYITIIMMLLLLTGCKIDNLREKPKEEKNQIEKLSYSVPATFKKSKLSKDNYHIYKYDDKYSICEFSITSMTPFNKDLDVVIQSYMFTEEEKKTKEKTINNQVWKYSSDYRKTKGIYYAYATIYQDVLYVVEYDDMGIDSYCSDSFKKIMKSLKMEE